MSRDDSDVDYWDEVRMGHLRSRDAWRPRREDGPSPILRPDAPEPTAEYRAYLATFPLNDPRD